MSYRTYVALGDSFTEGVGDPDPARPNGLRGWADRVAETLAAQAAAEGHEFGYANLAIRGRKLPQILAEQVDAAIALKPDLVTIHGGGNDVLRPKVDIDALAAAYDEAIGRLTASGAKVVMFTIADTGGSKVFAMVRGRFAIFNEWVREIAEKHDATIVDLWRLRDWTPEEIMDEDRLHMNPIGHQRMSLYVLDALGIDHGQTPAPADVAPRTPKEQRQANIDWATTHLAPWVHRRVTGRSSGDDVQPKRPTPQPIAGS